ncbi:MAG: FHA domain-containing protein [Fibromonadaceae bacterium]|jgi:pSer/pThr/pTyr-binding forkhead associated (FHA) protein|nr:FHA domain-containing protein [Fibromonadaceae bacterium]
MPSLSILYPEESRQTLQIPENGLLIGRSPYCDLYLPDEFISARHCKIFFENESQDLFIEDQGSTNGTFIDGTQVEKKSPLKEGQRIQIGITEMKII